MYARRKKFRYRIINNNDMISKLPDELLHNILSRLSTKEAVMTSLVSPRWMDLPHLILDMRNVLIRTNINNMHKISIWLANSMTKTLKNHRGPLESCIIHHYLSQCENGTLESWINIATRMKDTKDLTLVNHNYHGIDERYQAKTLLRLRRDAFSHHSLTSLSLCGFSLFSPRAFRNCSNLKTLKLVNSYITQGTVLTNVLAACPSLEVIVLRVSSLTQGDVLKIENNNLKFLQVTYAYEIEKIEVYAACLDVLDIKFIDFEEEDFILAAPNICQFKRDYWACSSHAHLSYNVSYLAQEKKNIWHALMVSESDFFQISRRGSLSVSLDVTNPKEVEILKEVLLMWNAREMTELEILFKNNNAAEEDGEGSTNGRAHETLWEDAKPFPNADFRVSVVWMFNFDGSNEEGFALASQFVMQKTVTKKMMIEISSSPPEKKLKVEAAVAKLMELPKGIML
ncbi:unnamed protein product [Thlaspi arvense]|uniref:F-box domain-containing protein n=1 Tax=Thlaspi arvense TaxID=13288 RepID=A0AAU9SC93_THLAR|nr:unnamed protein product [Thlaspi arvense]